VASEAKLNISMTITKGNISYQSKPTSFGVTLVGTAGPTVGMVLVPTEGRDIYFEELDTPGLVRIQNLDTVNYVEYGVYDPSTATFFPLGEILPGETYILRLSRNLNEEYAGSGTGTTAPQNYFRIKANGDDCNVLVEAFEA
jgi:hypothetical protein